MIDNLFSPSFGNRPDTFVGRSETISAILRGLQELPGSRERAVLISGQRGYGKTALLLELAEAATHEGYVVASPTVVSSGMLGRILEKLRIEGSPFLNNEKHHITGGSTGLFGFSAGTRFQGGQAVQGSFAQQLSDLCAGLKSKGKGVLILIDEVSSKQEELKQLIIAYQELVGQGRNISMIMAGLPAAVASTLQDHVLTFLNRARKIMLGPLGIQDIEVYYRKAFGKLGVEISDSLCRTAAARTSGSPYLMQLIGHYITIGSDSGKPVSNEDLDEAVRMAEKDFVNDICQTSLSALSERDVDFLKAMAASGTAEVSMMEIQERMNVSSAYVQIYRKRLLQSGIIESKGRGKVVFAIPFLHQYLAESDD